MSTIKVDTVQSTGGGAVTLTNQSASKFRVHHSGDAPTTNESFNMSTLTDEAAGRYSYAFSNNFNTVYWTFSIVRICIIRKYTICRCIF